MPIPANDLERLQARRAEASRAYDQLAAQYQAQREELTVLRGRLAALGLDRGPDERAALYDRQRILVDTTSALMIKVNEARRQLADLDEAIDKLASRIRQIDTTIAARQVELSPEGRYTREVEAARARLEQAERARRQVELEVEELRKTRRALAPDAFKP
jgi:chromosome segregation ATPase